MPRGNAVPEASVAAPAPQPAAAARVLTLDEALELAEPKSEQVTIATAGVTRAESQEQRVAQRMAAAGVRRGRLRSGAGVGVLRPVRRVRSVLHSVHGESRTRRCRIASPRSSVRCATARRPRNVFGGGRHAPTSSDGDNALPFGQPNTYRVNLAFSQNVYTGGRLQAQQAQARLGRENATLTLTSTRAQLALDVVAGVFRRGAERSPGRDRRRDAGAGRANRRSGAAAARGGTHGRVRSAARAGGARHRAAAGDPRCATRATSPTCA